LAPTRTICPYCPTPTLAPTRDQGGDGGE
jgi:hypothetical protein